MDIEYCKISSSRKIASTKSAPGFMLRLFTLLFKGALGRLWSTFFWGGGRVTGINNPVPACEDGCYIVTARNSFCAQHFPKEVNVKLVNVKLAERGDPQQSSVRELLNQLSVKDEIGIRWNSATVRPQCICRDFCSADEKEERSNQYCGPKKIPVHTLCSIARGGGPCSLFEVSSSLL